MHVIDHSLARPSPAAAALVSGSPQAGGEPLMVCAPSSSTAGFSHGNATTTRSDNHSSVSKGQGEKLIDLGAATKRSPVTPRAPAQSRGLPVGGQA